MMKIKFAIGIILLAISGYIAGSISILSIVAVVIAQFGMGFLFGAAND